MADRMFEGHDTLPLLGEGGTTEEKLERILDYLARMDEQYRYILCQLQERQ